MADTATTTDAANGTGEFTPEQQAKIDALVKDRLARQAAQLKKDQPGDEELEALRSKAAQFDAIEETSKDDLQKANETIDALQKKLAEKDSEMTTLTTTLRDTTVKQAVISEAAKAQFGEKQNETFVDPEDAYLRLDKSTIEYDDEGNATNIADLVGKVAESKPHLLGARQTPPPSLDGGARETSTDSPDLSPEQEHARWLAERI